MNNLLWNEDLSAEPSVRMNRDFTYKKKSKGIAFLLWLFLGVFGAHRYYAGDVGLGIAMTLTCGGGGVWFIIDAFFIGKRIDFINRELELKREQEIRLWNRIRAQEIRLQNQLREQEISLHNQKRAEEIRLLNQSIEQEIRIRNRKKEHEYEERIRRSGILQVDEMTGEVFEEFLRILLKERGYKVSLTATTGDYGADLILSNDNKKIAVQAKRYNSKVGITAVQEVVSAKSYYGADECWVITNNFFTAPAEKLAASNDVMLIDRDKLLEWMIEEDKVV